MWLFYSADNVIVGGIIGGIMLMTRIVQVFVDAVRIIIGRI